MCSGASGIFQMWSSSVECSTVASSARHSAGRSAGDRTGEEGRVGAVDQVEAAVARQQEGVGRAVAGRDRLGQGLDGFPQRAVDRADAEGARYVLERRQRVRDRQPVQQPVDRADLEGMARGVDQQHQAVRPGPGRSRRVFLAQPQIGRPPVVTVGDQRLTVRQIPLDLGQFGGIGDRPEAVAEAVVRGGGEQRRAPYGAFDDGRRAGRVALAAVRQEQRFQVGGGRPHQGRAVLDDVRHHVLVRQDDTFGGRRECQGPDDAALEQIALALLVHVQRRFRVRCQDAFGEPAPERVRRLAVAVGGGRGLGQDQPDDVVRVGRLQVEQPVRPYDDVVRRRGHGGEAAHPLGDVAQSAERDEAEAFRSQALWCSSPHRMRAGA